jgi:predicted HTH transcriptional regulator
MIPRELQILVNKGEGITVEFKKTTAQLHAAFETICAFLNGKGGVVLIGVTDVGIGNNWQQSATIDYGFEYFCLREICVF